MDTERALGDGSGRGLGVRRVVPVGIVLVVLICAAVLSWARLSLETSTAARAIWWRASDVGDQYRFPEHVVQPAPRPRALDDGELPAGILEQVRLADGSVAELSDLLEASDTTAFVVVHEGRLVTEWYPDGWQREDRQTSFSVAKSFVSALVGQAVDREQVALDDPVTDYVPELLERDRRFGAVTIRHLLTMMSGIRYVERTTPWSDNTVTYYAPDLRAAAVQVAVDHEPGTRWLYNNYNPILLGMVLERATGKPVTQLFEDLWSAMGAEFDASWSLDETGFAKMESGINARPVDFARFGLLFLDGGEVDGRRVLSEEWICLSTAADDVNDPSLEYQFMWWVDNERPQRFFAAGHLGQYIYVAPDVQTVVVRMGSRVGVDGGWMRILRDVADRVGQSQDAAVRSGRARSPRSCTAG